MRRSITFGLDIQPVGDDAAVILEIQVEELLDPARRLLLQGFRRGGRGHGRRRRQIRLRLNRARAQRRGGINGFALTRAHKLGDFVRGGGDLGVRLETRFPMGVLFHDAAKPLVGAQSRLARKAAGLGQIFVQSARGPGGGLGGRSVAHEAHQLLAVALLGFFPCPFLDFKLCGIGLGRPFRSGCGEGVRSKDG